MRGNFIAEHRAEYAKIRERLANKQPKAAKLTYKESVENGFKIDKSYVPPKPNLLGTQVLKNYPLATLVDYFDWTPFFISWSLTGKFPKILEDEVVGEAATDLYNQAQAMLKDIIDNNRFDARAVFGMFLLSVQMQIPSAYLMKLVKMLRILLSTYVSNLTK